METKRKFLLGGAAMGLALGLGAGALQAKDLTIGMVVTLSGPPAALGKQIVDGFKLALDQKGGMLGGEKVNLVIQDDELKPDVARQKAEELVKRDHADFVVGTVFSNMLMAIFKPVVTSKTFLISPNAGPSTFAGKNCNPFFFATSYQNDQNAQVAGMIANQEGFKNAFVMVPNYQAGRDNVAGFKKTYKGKITAEAFTPLGHKDFSPQLARIATSNSDSLFTFMPGGMGVALVKQFTAAGLKDKVKFLSVFTTDETTLPAQKDDALGDLAAGNWAPDAKTPASEAFVAAFEKKYGYIPGGYAMQAYDTAMLIDSAVAKVKGDLSDKKAVQKALEAADFTSLRGGFKFNNNHYPIQNFYLLKVAKNAKDQYHTSIVREVVKDYGDAYHQQCKMKM
ncbi:ABC transporter substrate-binding protein [Defluviimonas sp. 20V17]|uniref:ABC transporter substrate-binding protein n=1 Tax=Allgaiera indica TaxID=765699 RepID=A0AAN4UPV2_9RHOB|nr:ABC transporter substrate-binding protein [Allgaiera indica]KDB03272.1 ABC transporter substrate-binding protein [Defluviimonas sp. 20V17]GHE00572.1 ABC transporter substrate-binding protein [Allgaiera indica]SDW59547.1 amino acid/amide ABC transporter substrate-binding protein, HAAT family [Allgaiera indica]